MRNIHFGFFCLAVYILVMYPLMHIMYGWAWTTIRELTMALNVVCLSHGYWWWSSYDTTPWWKQ